MRRRRFLVTTTALLTAGGLAGCTASSSDPDTADNSGTDTPTQSTATPTETPATPTATRTSSTGTPEWVSGSCDSEPSIEGLPSPPETLTEDSVVEYVRKFERAYVVATNDEYGGIDSIDVTDVESGSDEYRVQLAVEGVAATSTDDGTATQTPQPSDATAHRATYRLFGPYLRREHRGYAGGQVISADCWTVERE